MHRSILQTLKQVSFKSRRLKPGVVTTCVFAILLLLLLLLLGFDNIYPPELSKVNYLSPILLDKNDHLMNVALSQDEQWRLSIRLEEVDPLFIKMLINIEDKRFFYHPGVDPFALLRALKQAFTHGKVISGGSTLTLQVIRLLHPRPRTLKNKCIEMLQALQLELHYTKAEILEFYLQLAPYGGNIAGLRAASYLYFGKEPKHLRESEAVLLVALPQSPEKLRPEKYPFRAKAARDKILRRLSTLGVLSRQQAQEALQESCMITKRPFSRYAPHLLNELIKQSPTQSTFATTLSLQMQKQLEDVLGKQLVFLDPTETIAALVVENETNNIICYMGSADVSNLKRQGYVNMIKAFRSPGSLLKPFIYALGFDQGLIHPETLIMDAPTEFSGYAPSNFRDVFHGTTTIREALQQSFNIPAVLVLERLGPINFTESLKNLGIKLKFQDEKQLPTLPIALGGLGIRLQDLVALYCALANEGEFKGLRFERKQMHRELNKGENPTNGKKPERWISAVSALHITSILEEAPAPLGFVDRRSTKEVPIAYKTGTSYGYRDAWAIGYTPEYTIGIWVGRPDGGVRHSQTGRDTALPLLFKVVDFLPASKKSFHTKNTRAQLVTSQTPQIPLVLTKKNPQKQNLQVVFPKHQSILMVEEDDNSYKPIALRIAQGTPPYYLLEDGHLLPEKYLKQEIAWIPKTRGFHNLTVLDSIGASSTISIEIK